MLITIRFKYFRSDITYGYLVLFVIPDNIHVEIAKSVPKKLLKISFIQQYVVFSSIKSCSIWQCT